MFVYPRLAKFLIPAKPDLKAIPTPKRLPHELFLEEAQNRIFNLERQRQKVREEIDKAKKLEQSLTDTIDALDAGMNLLLSLVKVEDIAAELKDEPLEVEDEQE